jgi:hypothetical protein
VFVQNFNPGEPVFDQETGEPYIDEDGALVEVSPLSTVIATDGREFTGDDVANAAWYRVNLYEGEIPRDASIGVPYQRLALGQSDPGFAIGVVVAEARSRTPGVAGVVGVRADTFDQATRVLIFSATLPRKDGAEVATTTTVGG